MEKNSFFLAIFAKRSFWKVQWNHIWRFTKRAMQNLIAICVCFRLNIVVTLKAHINSVHLKGKLDKIPKCSICGKALSSKQSLKNYTQLHSNEEFQCKLCNYKKRWVYTWKIILDQIIEERNLSVNLLTRQLYQHVIKTT